jgi:DNA-binding response OmpR family regulator
MLLIISQSKKTARSIAETFHYMSILSYGATPHEALSEISCLYRAVLIINPDSFPDILDYVNRIKSYKSDLPVFAILDEEPPSYYADIFDACFTKPEFTPSLAEKIISYANQNNRTSIGDYYLAGFDASSHTVGVYYFNTKVGLTKTEAMILRYLIRSYPTPQGAQSILKYAFKPTRAPEPSSIRTHLSLMNKKFEESIGRKMISLEPGLGYVILTPEYLFTKK